LKIQNKKKHREGDAFVLIGELNSCQPDEVEEVKNDERI